MPFSGYIYQILIREQLDNSWSQQLNGLTIIADPRTNGTIIWGLVRDQASLRGLLNQIFNFNLTLVGLSREEISNPENYI